MRIVLRLRGGFAMVLLSGILSASSQSINVDIQTTSDPLHSGSDGVLSGAGAYWNNSATEWSNLKDEFGSSTGVALVLVQWLGSVTRSGGHALFGEGLSAGWSSPLIYEVVNLNPYHTYDCALYVQSSARAEVYMSDYTQLRSKKTLFLNTRTLPGADQAEYLRFNALRPYEISSGVYGFRFYVYSQSSITYEAFAGLQLKASGSVANIAPRRPSAVFPANAATGVPASPDLVASAFDDPDAGDAHVNSQWLVDNQSAFSSPEWNSGDTHAAGTSATVPAGLLAPGTTYYWKVRYKDNQGNWSAYSASRSFTTGAGNTAPTDIALANGTVAENLPAGAMAGQFSTTDANPGDTFVYALVSGEGDADNASFSLEGPALRSALVFNHEVKSALSVRVRSTDAAGAFVEKSFLVQVGDVEETPRLLPPVLLADGRVVLRWDSVANHVYTLHQADSLRAAFAPVLSNIAATPPMNSHTTSVQTVQARYWSVSTIP